MAIPVVRAVGTVASGLSVITPGLPTGTVLNDILVLFVETGNEPLPAMTGWSNVGAGTVQQAGGVVTALTILWKRAGSSETAPSVPDAGDHQIARIVGVSGCPTAGDPWDVTSYTTENVADTSVSTPAITTLTADTLVFCAAGNGQDTATAQGPSTWTNASLTSVTSRCNDWTASGNGGGFSVMTGGKATAGAVSASTGTITTANFKTLFTGALKSAVAAPAPVWPPHRRGPNYRR